jgi:putative ABC transport system permease protein
MPAIHGFVTGLARLLGFSLPPLLALGNVPPLRVLRRDIGTPGGMGWFAYVLGAAVIAGLILWKAGELRLGLWSRHTQLDAVARLGGMEVFLAVVDLAGQLGHLRLRQSCALAGHE